MRLPPRLRHRHGGDELRQHQEMEALYRREVLKEQPSEPVLEIQALGGGRKTQELQEVVHKPTV